MNLYHLDTAKAVNIVVIRGRCRISKNREPKGAMPLYIALSTSSVPYFSLSPHQGLYQYNNYRKKVNECHTHNESLCMVEAKIVCAQACLVVVDGKATQAFFSPGILRSLMVCLRPEAYSVMTSPLFHQVRSEA